MRDKTIYKLLIITILLINILSCVSTKKDYISTGEKSCTGILPNPTLLEKENVDLNMLNLAIKDFSIGNFNISRNNNYKPLLDKDSLAFWIRNEIICNAAKVFEKASDKKWYYAMMQVSKKNSPKEFLEWLKDNPPYDYQEKNSRIEKKKEQTDDSRILKGNECYHYGDNETVTFAKDEAKIQALIEAIESMGSFIESNIVIVNGELKKKIIKKLSSGYIKILKSEYKIDGRNVCCEIEISTEEAQKIFEKEQSIKTPEMLKVQKAEYQITPELMPWFYNPQKTSINIDKSFEIMKCEVTVCEFRLFFEEEFIHKQDKNDHLYEWYRNDDTCPVTNISWEAANAYAKWLSKKTSYVYQLPSRNQWMAACIKFIKTTKTAHVRNNSFGTQKLFCQCDASKMNFLLGNVSEWSSDSNQCSSGYFHVLGEDYLTLRKYIEQRTVATKWPCFKTPYQNIGFRLVKITDK
jgi:formylglycine-generating enzyme required for sulfatase activity